MSPEFNLGLDSNHVDNSEKPLNKRYYYKWERTSTRKIASYTLDKRSIENKEAFMQKMEVPLAGIGEIPDIGIILEFMGTKHMEKFANFTYGRKEGKLDLWEGKETRYKYDVLKKTKTPAGKRIILTSQSFGINKNGTYEAIDPPITYTLKLK